jgi:hypothetical protein
LAVCTASSAPPTATSAIAGSEREETFRQTARSFDNPDFVDVVVHSYMHRIHNAPGDPRYAPIEAKRRSKEHTGGEKQDR